MHKLELLKSARELLADPARWTQHCMARTESQVPVNPCTAEAACWCASGAIMRQHEIPEEDRIAAILALNQGVPGNFPQEHCAMTRVIKYNDSASHLEVLAMFDRVINGYS